MPVKIQNELPAFKILSNDNIFVMDNERAYSQDIRPLKVIVLNLMPKKITTENQLLRYLSNTPLQVEITFLKTKTYKSHNTPIDHLQRFYKYFENIKDEKFDGLIVTGAPVERMDFEEVAYWNELVEIMDWSRKNVFSTLYICWGAQAGLYHNYNIQKYELREKLSGIFTHHVNDEHVDITRGLSDVFRAPHSRYTEVRRSDIEKVRELEILSESDEAGVFIAASKDRREIYITGHLEYDKNTLRDEYIRDKEKGLDVPIPKNYFENNNINGVIKHTWRSSASIIFSNWLNYCVYQNTPYNLQKL